MSGSTVTRVQFIRGTPSVYVSIDGDGVGREQTAADFKTGLGLGTGDTPQFSGVNATAFANGTAAQTTIGNATGGISLLGQTIIAAGTALAPAIASSNSSSRGWYTVPGGHWVYAANNTSQIVFNPGQLTARSDLEIAWTSGAAYAVTADTRIRRQSPNVLAVYGVDGMTMGTWYAASFANGATAQTTIGNATGGNQLLGPFGAFGVAPVARPQISASTGTLSDVLTALDLLGLIELVA
jgi:hypothetical protein